LYGILLESCRLFSLVNHFLQGWFVATCLQAATVCICQSRSGLLSVSFTSNLLLAGMPGICIDAQ
jgi:hypothetical protein